ncbi:MAG: DUF3106 domain-containing protein [Planctomycetota bacterium]
MRIDIAITKSRIALALAAWLLAPALCAQEGPDAGSTAPALRPYGENLRRWQGLSDEQRRAIRDRAETLTPGQLDELRRRLAEFKNLPHEDQERIRGNCRRFRGLRPAEKGNLEQGHARFMELPEEKKAELRRQFRMRRRGAPAGGPQEGVQPPTGHGGPHRRGQGGPGASQEGNLEREAERKGAIEGPPLPPTGENRRTPAGGTPGQPGHPPDPGRGLPGRKPEPPSEQKVAPPQAPQRPDVPAKGAGTARKKPGAEEQSKDAAPPEGAKRGGKGDGPADSGQKKQPPGNAPDRAGWKRRPGGPPDRSGGDHGGNRGGNRNGRGRRR